jgi:O-antigen/teichoic acid export membrane protein
MKSQRKLSDSGTIRRDITLSILIGPLKFVIPIVGYLILYPTMLLRVGVEVLGLWSIFTTITSYMNVADVGYSLLLTREAGRDLSAIELQGVSEDYIAAQRFYTVTLFAILSLLSLLGTRFFSYLGNVYSVNALVISTVVLTVGTFIQLNAKLDAAILSAYNDNYFVQSVSAMTPVFPFTATIIATLKSMPIEGFAVGVLLGSIAQIALYRYRLRYNHQQWQKRQHYLPWYMTFRRIKGLITRGWHLYSISLAFIMREPIFRVVLATSLGLPAVGVYDIAMRITRTVRNILASGFVSIYPALAYLHRTRNQKDTRDLIQASLLLLLGVGAGSLSLLIITAHSFFPLWLNEVPQGLIKATQILSIWTMITLMNVPFWYLLQATGYEKVASYAIWMHTLSVLFLVPVSKVIILNLSSMLIYWTIGSIITQILVYFYVEKKLSLFWDLVLKPRILYLLIATLGFFITAFMISAKVTSTDVPISLKSVLAYLAFFLTYSIIVWPAIWSPLKSFISHNQVMVFDTTNKNTDLKKAARYR